MPLKPNVACLKCETNESLMWTNVEGLGVICFDCVKETKEKLKAELEEDDDKVDVVAKSKKKPRTTRSYKTRLNPMALPKTTAPKGRGRRSLFKRTPVKAPASVATVVTSDSVFYKGSYFQVGDIVSMMDAEDNTYYAQLRGFLTDQYCEKSACITWLLPTKHSPAPEVAFDAATYIIGPEEDLPRKLSCMEFVMHAPSDYYKDRTTPYPPVDPPAKPGYIWTSLPTVVHSQTSTSKE